MEQEQELQKLQVENRRLQMKVQHFREALLSKEDQVSELRIELTNLEERLNASAPQAEPAVDPELVY